MTRFHLLSALSAALLLAPLMVQAQNRPPVADAGPDQYIFTNDTTSLIGSATDPDNDPIEEWLWAFESVPASSSPLLTDPTLSITTFFADVPGEYATSLSAFDGIVWSDPDYTSVFVADLLGPDAVATADVTSGVGSLTVQFDGSGSTGPMLFDGTSTFSGTGTGWDDGSADWDALTYRWNFGDQSALSFDVAPSHTYTAPGDYLATLRVFDDLGNSDLATIGITVSAIPIPPSVWLFGSGLIGLVGIARRRRKAV